MFFFTRLRYPVIIDNGHSSSMTYRWNQFIIYYIEISLMIDKKTKMVVVWGNQNILSSSIQYLLAAKDDWKVVCISSIEDFNSIVLPIENQLSDIVIIHSGEQDGPSNLPLQLLEQHADIRVISISLVNNVMDIYNKQSLLVKEASDLITAIENEVKPQDVIIHAS